MELSPFCWGGGGEWNFLLTFQKGGLKGPQFLEGGRWERGGLNFFRESFNFYRKIKLKYEIFNDKKIFEQKCFSVSLLRIQTKKF